MEKAKGLGPQDQFSGSFIGSRVFWRSSHAAIVVPPAFLQGDENDN